MANKELQLTNIITDKIVLLVEQARKSVAKNTNTTMLFTYFHIGKLLVEVWQQGEKRASYGENVLKNVSANLTEKLGKGFSVQNLERMRNFFLLYSKSSKELRNSDVFAKSSNTLRISDGGFSINLLPINWSHYLFLMRIKNEQERQFYEIESYQNQWTLEELERQFNTGLFERLSVSKNQEEVLKLSREGQLVANPKDLMKDPLVLDFLDLKSDASYTETDLETAIINQIEKFMLELGKGFFFGGRQMRFSFNEEHYFVDLVFYNRILRCFVLIDLKIGKLKHQDLGQMQMYVNYYDRFVKQNDENNTVGIVICKTKEDTIVEITLPKDYNQIFAAQYETIIPSKEILKQVINLKRI
jgi:predicted nuclease of restriction endonuclease-like (RecB) superfamily